MAMIAGLLLAASALPVWAEMGPCRPDGYDSFLCGTGKGAARVIEGTISPNQRLALAWRTLTGEPTEQPGDEIDLLLVRLADGAVLAVRETDYWATGSNGRVNRFEEQTAWSRDSRMAIRAFHSRWSTDHLDLFILGPKDDLVGTLDLLPIVSPALRARLKPRVRNVDNWAFSIDADKMSVGNDGALRMRATIWMPKEGPEYHFQVSLQVTHSKGAPKARLTAIRPVRDSR
jgi:hypothetical protein